MTKNIRTILTPVFIISYVCGIRIIEFPVGQPRVLFSLLYMLLFWSIVFFLLLKFIMLTHFIIYEKHNIEFCVCIGFDILIIILSIMFGIYYDKKFRNCLKKLSIVDNTLLNIETTTDYYKMHKKTIYLILGWIFMTISMNCGSAYYKKNDYNCNILTMFYYVLMQNCCYFINIINDLIIANVLGYIGLKFDQINQHLLDLVRNDKRGIKRAWENSMQHIRFSQASNNEWVIWIIIHLHSELRKICCEIDSIFGVHMTLQMANHFCWLAFDLRELFRIILNNDTKSNKISFSIAVLIWTFFNFLQLFFINYVCEAVSTKANATGSLINKLPYSTYDVEVRENVSFNISLFKAIANYNMSQLVLQITRAPVKFYGIGLFQYGYKFFYGFSSSITTVVVLLVQSYVNEQTFSKISDN